jgi:integrase
MQKYFCKNKIFSAPYFLRLAGFSKILDQQFQLIRAPRSKITPIFAVDVFNRSFNNQRWYIAKTEASNRKIDLGPAMMKELKAWKLACPPNDLDLIFPNEAGQPINHNNLVNRHFEPALIKAGLPRIRFHDLRHTFASLLIEQGENIKYIQSQLGHSSPTVTWNVYAHLMKSTNQEAPSKLENTIFETNGSKTVAENKKEITMKTVTS